MEGGDGFSTAFAYFEQNAIADADGVPYSVHKKDMAYEAVVYPNADIIIVSKKITAVIPAIFVIIFWLRLFLSLKSHCLDIVADADGVPYSVHKKDMAYEAVVYPNEEKTGYVFEKHEDAFDNYDKEYWKQIASEAVFPTVVLSAESTRIVLSSASATRCADL